MSGQDPQHVFAPLSQAGESGPLWDPNGPDGQLIDPTAGRGGVPIGELAQLPYPPLHGWVRGDNGTAVPDHLGVALVSVRGGSTSPTKGQATFLLLLS